MGYEQMVVSRHGDPEVLTRVTEHDRRSLIPNAVRRRVCPTVATCPAVLMREEIYPNIPKSPFVPSYGVVGVAPTAHRLPEDAAVQGQIVLLCDGNVRSHEA